MFLLWASAPELQTPTPEPEPLRRTFGYVPTKMPEVGVCTFTMSFYQLQLQRQEAERLEEARKKYEKERSPR